MLLDLFFLNSNVPACQRLIKREFTPREFPLLIENIYSSKDGSNTIRRLPLDSAQTFIDVIDQARSTFTHRRESMKLLRLTSMHSVD